MADKNSKTINVDRADKSIAESKSVWYNYEVNVGSGCATGSVLVSECATDDEIRLAIMNDLYEVSYHRQETPKNKY